MGSWNSYNREIKDLAGNVIWKYDDEAAKAAFQQHNPYVLEHVDWVNHIRKGEAHDEAEGCAISCLAGVMGREAAYTGATVTLGRDERFGSGLHAREAGDGSHGYVKYVVPVRQRQIIRLA